MRMGFGNSCHERKPVEVATRSGHEEIAKLPRVLNRIRDCVIFAGIFLILYWIFVVLATGMASHYLAGGKMTFPIFMVAYMLILSGLKGRGKLIGLIVFTITAALVVVVLQQLQIK